MKDREKNQAVEVSNDWRMGIRKRLLIAALLVLLIMGSVVIIGLRYLGALHNVINEESYAYLNEISVQMTANLERVVGEMQQKAKALSQVAAEMEWEDAQQLTGWMDKRKENFGLSQIYLLDADGYWYHDGHKKKQELLQEFSVDIIEHRMMRMIPAQNVDDVDYMMLGIPADITTMDGVHIEGLAVALDEESVKAQLVLDVFEGAGYAYIVTNDGRLIVGTDNQGSLFEGYSLFTNLERVQLQEGISLEMIRETFRDGGQIQCEYKIENNERLMTLTPTGVEDWYLVSVLPRDYMLEESNLFMRLTMTVCLATGLIFVMLVLGIVVLQWHTKQRLMKAAYVDPVTGGNTRLRFMELAQENIRNTKITYALIYVNVTDFKIYNERLGKIGADKILADIYREIDRTLNRSECMGRIMADHYGVLLAEKTTENILSRISMWNKAFSDAEINAGNLSGIHLTCGIYFIKERSMDFIKMLDNANLARQTIRLDDNEEIHYAVYDEAVKERQLYEKELVKVMEPAMLREQFKLYLQPKYTTDGYRIAGAEALVRWEHPVRGLIMPGDFIPLFEANGSIEKLDLYMFRHTCEWIRGTIEEGLEPIPVSVNLSRSHFRHRNFLEEFIKVWKDYQFDASLIEFEFTESMFEGQFTEFIDVIRQLHEIGFACSMDDFGSGYSSLNMLSHLPLDVVKLDGKFFPSTGEMEPQVRTTIQGIISLLKALHMKVVAEGVEQQEQVEMLKQSECDLIQGFVFSRPVPAEELSARLRESVQERKA